MAYAHTRYIGTLGPFVLIVPGCVKGEKSMKETSLERALVRAVSSMGGMALKFVSPGMAGVPDRLVLMPEARIAFVEMKAPGEKTRPLQRYRMEQLRSLGFRVFVIDGRDQIREMLEEIKKRCPLD